MLWWREVHAADIPAAMRQVEAWGYPRKLHEDEKESVWCSFGHHGFAWLEPMTGGEWMLHLCAAPESRRRMGLVARQAMRDLRVIAGFLGASRLTAMVDRDLEVARYVLRLGWHRDVDRGLWTLEVCGDE